jgi:hypothetical protein
MNWRNKKEQAKHIILMGRALGIEAKTWGQRAEIARKYMPRLERYETAEFKKDMKKITFRTVKVNDWKEGTYYL